jgi:small GTP-binding protein
MEDTRTEKEKEADEELRSQLPPGVKLVRTLRGHTDWIGRVVWSPDGTLLASPSVDGMIRVWDKETGGCIRTIECNQGEIFSVAFNITGNVLASSGSKNVKMWEVNSGGFIGSLGNYARRVHSVVFNPTGTVLAEAGENSDIHFWDPVLGRNLLSFKGGNGGIGGIGVTDIAFSADGNFFANSSGDKTVKLWNANSGELLGSLHGHDSITIGLVFISSANLLASSGSDGTVKLWEITSGKLVRTLEGHSDEVTDISVTADERFLATRSGRKDSFIGLWRCDTWECIVKIPGWGSTRWPPGLAFHPRRPLLASVGSDPDAPEEERDRIIHIFELDWDGLLGQAPTDSVSYTTAKIVLVGDSGVGKTGLGWRLAHDEYKEHSSTHGQQFWVIDELSKKRNDGTECEAVLWDLAGQPDYRLVHSLFLDDVDTALILFDPTKRQEPLSGVDFWINQLRCNEENLCDSILVGARSDRGTSTLTDEELRDYCDRNGIRGGYIATSAEKGEGLNDLVERLKAQIPWEEMATTVTTRTFKRIKEYVLELKEQADRKNVLVRPNDLHAQLQASDTDWQFSHAEMMTAVGHLATHGYVTILRSSKGDKYILLAPDLLANLASSIVLEARRHPRGLGVLEENRLLKGDCRFTELDELDKVERDILLDAVTMLFLQHNLCFREIFNEQTILVFPSLINEKLPKDGDLTEVEGASYTVKGAVENVYASLVVLLGYTNTFMRTNQWQNQAQYEMGEGEICGFEQFNPRDGEIELVLYYAENTPDPVRTTFRGLFERFLSRRKLKVSRYQTVVCPECEGRLERKVVMTQLAKEKKISFCNECGEKLNLPNPEPLTRLSDREEVLLDTEQDVVRYRTAFEAALVRVKALLRDRGAEEISTCFISYAWGIPDEERWVRQLAKDLRKADINILLDRWESIPGSNLDRYVAQILECDFVVPIGTPKLLQKYDTEEDNPVVKAELKLIDLRVRQPNEYGETVIPALLSGDAKRSLTPQLQPLVNVDFREKDFYFRKLFDLIWRMHDLPFDHPLLEELQQSMSPRRE